MSGPDGIVKRRHRGTPTVIAASVVAGAAFGAAMIVALGALARLRHLLFDTVTANIDGIASVLARWVLR
ncbi:hypothetical protein I552_0415 [Mycobacterium xenopi 3993]|nr:hypothetical protein I552_0415 [Mycobacterium xenopi 3993]